MATVIWTIVIFLAIPAALLCLSFWMDKRAEKRALAAELRRNQRRDDMLYRDYVENGGR